MQPEQICRSQSQRPFYRSIATWLTSGILLTAGFGKLGPLFWDQYYSESPTLWIAISVAEIWIGVALLSENVQTHAVAWLACVCLLVLFLGYSIATWPSGEPCGCLGIFDVDFLPHWFLLSLLGTLVAMARPSDLLIQMRCDRFPTILRTLLLSFFAYTAVAALSLVTLTVTEARVLLGLGGGSVRFDGCTEKCGRIEFDAIPVGESRQGSVSLKNLGKRTVEIVGCRPSCGCTVIDVLPGEILAGETQRIEFVYTQKSEGLNRSHVTFFLGSSIQPSITARIESTGVSDSD